MYQAVLKIQKKGEENCISLDFGRYSRPSTAERRRKELADYNPSYCFTLVLEAYEPRNETESF